MLLKRRFCFKYGVSLFEVSWFAWLPLGSLFFLFLTQPVLPAFSGEKAYIYLKEQCALGTREPGSPGHKRTKIFLENFMKKQKGVFQRQDFIFQDTVRNRTLPLTNFRLLFPGKTKKRYLLCAHWDTRPWADQERNPLKKQQPILGANDGASGVAVLMAMCDLFSVQQPNKTVEIVLFDGEDYGSPGDDNWFLGAKHFAKKIKPSDYAYAVLIDMVGDKDLIIPQEPNSINNAPYLISKIWKVAKQLGISSFISKTGPAVLDDHIPLIEKGIRTVVLIDFEYKYWHTLEDTPNKCSPESLEKVGRVLEYLIYE